MRTSISFVVFLLAIVGWVGSMPLVRPVFGQSKVSDDRGPISMTLSGQITAISQELLELFQTDPNLRDRRVRMSDFKAPNLLHSHYGIALERMLKARIPMLLDDQSELLLKGEYGFFESDSEDNRGFKTIVLELKVIDARGQVIVKTKREVNDTADMAQILTSTYVPPETRNYHERNQALDRSFTSPNFLLKEHHQVSAIELPSMAVQLVEGGRPIEIVDRDGFAMASLDSPFSLMLFNEAEFDVCAMVRFNGLDVANEFVVKQANEVSTSAFGYWVPRAENGKPGTAKVLGWRKSNTTKEVFPFECNELGTGSPNAIKSPYKSGNVSVSFFEVVDVGLSTRSQPFESRRAEAIDSQSDIVQTRIVNAPTAIVSIRFELDTSEGKRPRRPPTLESPEF